MTKERPCTLTIDGIGGFILDDGGEIAHEQIDANLVEARLKNLPKQTIKVIATIEDDEIKRVSMDNSTPSAAPAGRPSPTQPKHQADFHNPYNFIPTQDRKLNHPDLGDQKPTPHDCYYQDRYTGTIALTIEAVTPVLVPEMAATGTDDQGHKTYAIRVDAKGVPIIPPTSFKGMLRSAYEAVTNSRFGIFTGHEERLGFRTPPGKSAQEISAVRIETDESGQLRARYMETAKISLVDAKKFKHCDEVYFKPKEQKVYSKPKKQYEAIDVSKSKRDDKKLGYICKTEINTEKKKYEKIFYNNNEKDFYQISEKIREEWRNLIEDYQKIHATEIENGIRKPTTMNRPDGTWSRHITTPDDVNLREGMLCFAILNRSTRQVERLFPVGLSRSLFQEAPRGLLSETLKPATSREKLSPADRVFGWVKSTAGYTEKGIAHRGHLRVGKIHCLSGPDAIENFSPELTLAILGQPKPAQSLFYVARGNGHALGGQERRSTDYAPPHQLRGRKVYPHHQVAAENWHYPAKLESTTQDWPHYIRQPEDKNTTTPARDKQNRSLTGWIKPGTQFKTVLHITNLTAFELGALLWLVAGPEDGGFGRHHRFGLGKPLGFGSLKICLDKANTQLATGKDMRSWYSNLGATQWGDPSKIKDLIQEYKTITAAAHNGTPFERVPFIKAAIKAGEGFKSIHYPRLRGGDQQKIFEWFGQNEKANTPVGLPLLTDENPGLPLYVQTKSEQKHRR